MTNQIEFSKPGKWVMRITADRRIEVNKDIDVTEAAQLVLEALQTLLEQPKQEPVAWMSQAGNFLSPLEFTVGEAALYGWTPVYTTTPAPQRKPLTDDENRNAIRLYKADQNLMGVNHVHVARAVEAAHGIKETP